MARKQPKSKHNVHVQVDGRIWAATRLAMKATGVRFNRDAVERGLRLFVESVPTKVMPSVFKKLPRPAAILNKVRRKAS